MKRQTKKTNRVHGTPTISSSSQQPSQQERWFRATETSAKKWVIRYTAISAVVVFLLLSCASYTADVRKFCVWVWKLRIWFVYLSNYIEREQWTRANRTDIQHSKGKSLATHDRLPICGEKSVGVLENFDFFDKGIKKKQSRVWVICQKFHHLHNHCDRNRNWNWALDYYVRVCEWFMLTNNSTWIKRKTNQLMWIISFENANFLD